jgi:alkylation response protein AidB-like acyl-CoA dehydrogenase
MTATSTREAVCALLSRDDVAADVEAMRRRDPRDEVGIPTPHRLLGAHGWLAPAWPTRFGGQALDLRANAVVCEELALHGVPDTMHTLSVDIVGQILLRFGTEDQRSTVLPSGGRGRGRRVVHRARRGLRSAGDGNPGGGRTRWLGAVRPKELQP